MAKKFLTGLQLLNLTSDPAGGSEGELYYNTVSDKVRIFSDGVWRDLSASTSGSLVNIDSIQYPDYIAFDTTPESTSASVGTISWDSGDSTLSIQLDGQVNVGLGQEIIILANNGEATTLNKGEVVRLSGAQGQRPKITRAYNLNDTGSALTIGIVAENIAAGGEGFVVTQGIVKNIDTNAFNEGDILYLSASAGIATTVKPQAPNHYVFVGVVLKKNASSGRIYVKPQNGYELDELHNVRIISEANNDILLYNSASSIWINSPSQNIINTASAAAYASASTYTDSEISSLTTTDIEEGSNLYYTNTRGLTTASTALVHANHTNLTATYTSNQIRFSTTGGMSSSSGSAVPSASASTGSLYYRTNSTGTKIIQMYAYLNGGWIGFTGVEIWNDLLGANWSNIVPA